MKITRRQLDEIVQRELNEGFFSDLFKSKKTKRAEAAAAAAEIETQDKQKIREYYSDYLVISKFFMVDQNWHRNYAFVCEDTSGKKTLWYQSGREEIMVQIAGIGINPYPPGDEYAPGAMWLCKSTPLKRPYGGSTEEKIYEILNTYMNGFDTRDALPFPEELVNQLSERGKNQFVKLWRSEIVKMGRGLHGIVSYNVSNSVYSSNIQEALAAAISTTSEMSNDSIDGASEVLSNLLKLQKLYTENDPLSQETYEKADNLMLDLNNALGYTSMPPSRFDSSWADELY